MKLSEMNTKQLASALCDLTAPVGAITKDEGINGVFEGIAKRMQENEHMTMFEKTGMLLEAVPMLLAEHYEDTIKIACVMTGKKKGEVEEMNGMELIRELRECIDGEIIGFFRSSAAMAKTQTGNGE